jgi:hypothetical protein
VIGGVAHWLASTVVWDCAGRGPMFPNALLSLSVPDLEGSAWKGWGC